MDNSKLNGRKLHIWLGHNPIDDTIALAQAIATSAPLATQGGRLVQISEGRPPFGQQGWSV